MILQTTNPFEWRRVGESKLDSTSPKYRDLSDKKIEDFIINHVSLGVAIRGIIDADRALQLKQKNVKCRLFWDICTEKIHCATENSTDDWQSLKVCWIGPIFEREIP